MLLAVIHSTVHRHATVGTAEIPHLLESLVIWTGAHLHGGGR